MQKGPQGQFEWMATSAFGCLVVLLVIVVVFALTRVG